MFTNGQSNVLLGWYPRSSFIICFSAYIRRMLPGKFKIGHNSLDRYLIKFLALIHHKNHTLLVQHFHYLWNNHTCVLTYITWTVYLLVAWKFVWYFLNQHLFYFLIIFSYQIKHGRFCFKSFSFWKPICKDLQTV